MRVMSALPQAAQRQQRLALAAAPFALQVNEKQFHSAFITWLCRSASISFPSFWNFSHVLRADIREIIHPRRPSRNPRHITKLLNQFHGGASHIAARQLRFPSKKRYRASRVVMASTFAACSSTESSV